MTRILVAGAAGFVGANILRDLMQRSSIQVTGWIRPGGDAWRLKYLPHANIASVDITHTDDVFQAMNQCRPDVIINAATYGVTPQQSDPAKAYDINVHALATLLAAARETEVSRVLHLGSFFEYGDQSGLLREDNALMPKGVYAATKAAASLLIAGSDYGGMEVAALRLFNLWGLWENPARLVPQVIAACRNATPLALTSGTQAKDFVSVSDAAAWIGDLALQPSPLGHRIINLASGQMTTVKAFVTAVAETMGHPELMQFGAKPMPTTEPQTGPADTTRIDALLPNRKSTPLKDALADILRESRTI